MHQTKLKYVQTAIIDENDFDDKVWQRAQLKNNSGYLDEEYEITQEFPIIPDYHFRVEDDQTILQFQKLAMNDTDNQPHQFHNASDKFHNKLSSLLESINSVHIQPEQPLLNTKIERHGFYSLDKDYDNDSSIKEAFARLQVFEVEEKLKNLDINDKNKPKFIKKLKNNENKIKPESSANPVNNLSRQLNKLSIAEEDL